MTRQDTKLTPSMLAARFVKASRHATMPDDWTPVGAWIRVSSGKQDEANQVPQVIAYCVDRHYWPTHWYVVHAKSASKGEHQADLDRAVADMRDGEFSLLVIWHTDRIERRKGKALLDTLAEFTDAHGKVVSVQEPMLGEVGFGAELTTFVTGLVNAEKIDHLKEQVGIAHARIRANKAVGPGSLPWGYVTTGAKYEKVPKPTDLCKKVVPQIFHRCVALDSCRTIAEWLDSEGIPPKRGTKWNEGSVRKILHNMTYAGRWQDRDDKQTLVKCEAVVPMDLWEEAQEALKNHSHHGPINKANRPLLASLKCARCADSPMFRIRVTSRSGRYYYYYRCAGRGPQRKGCGNMVPLVQTDGIIWARVFLTSNEPHQTRQWVKGLNWDSDILDTKQDIREVTEAERWEELPALTAKLADYRHRNETKGTKGHYERQDVLKPDGSVMTEGEYFDSLTPEGKREYLKTRDIRVEKVLNPPDEPGASVGVRVVIDGEDHGVFPYPPNITATV